MRNTLSRRPLVFSVLAIVVPVLAIQGLDNALRVSLPDVLTRRLVIEALFVAYVVALTLALRMWRDAGFVAPVSFKRIAVCLPLLYLPALVLAVGNPKSAEASRVLGMTAFALMVGFAEEGLLRGVVLHTLGTLGVRRAVLLSSLIFGVAHLANVASEHDLLTVSVQATYATLLGIGFAGTRLYTGSIWPAIVLHSLVDLSDFASRGFELPKPHPLTPHDAIAPIILTGICALYGWWLVRGSTIQPDRSA